MHLEKVPFAETHSFSSFFLDYILQKDSLRPFYSRFPLKENFKTQRDEKSSFPKHHRKILVATLQKQYKDVHTTDSVKKNIASLSSERTFTITTGHQLNIFTGPLYFIYKIITVINTCKQLQQAYPEDHFVPVYWMASEDHDFAEISYFHLYGKKYTWQTSQSGAVGRFNPKSLEGMLKEVPGNTILFQEAYLRHNTLSDAAHLSKMNKLVKEIVPHRLTFIPLGTQSRDVLMPAAGFFACSDLVGWEMYPIANPKAADPSLQATETQMALVGKLAAKANRPYWVLPQTFAWPGGRAPTPAEYRNLCYVGLVNGAKGVMPWSIYHMVDSAAARAKKKAEGIPAWDEWYLPDNKELWAECGALAKEVKELAPQFLDGKRTKLTDGGHVTAAVWACEKETLLVVANLSETDAKSVSLTLPRGLDGVLKPAFKDRPTGLKLTDGKLAGELGKAAVHVYRLSVR